MIKIVVCSLFFQKFIVFSFLSPRISSPSSPFFHLTSSNHFLTFPMNFSFHLITLILLIRPSFHLIPLYSSFRTRGHCSTHTHVPVATFTITCSLFDFCYNLEVCRHHKSSKEKQFASHHQHQKQVRHFSSSILFLNFEAWVNCIGFICIGQLDLVLFVCCFLVEEHEKCIHIQFNPWELYNEECLQCVCRNVS